MQTMGNSTYTQGNAPGIDEIDAEFKEMTKDEREQLDSKNFEGEKYAGQIPKIEAGPIFRPNGNIQATPNGCYKFKIIWKRERWSWYDHCLTPESYDSKCHRHSLRL